MRKAETASKKALLLPLIPALAMGIVAVMPDAPHRAPISEARGCMTLEGSTLVTAPVVDHAPIRIEPPTCICTMSF